MSKKIKIVASEEGYDLAAKNYDQMEGYLNSFEQGYLFELIGNVAGKKALDAGAGTGRVAAALRRLGAKVTALDISEKMLAFIQKREPGIKIIQGDVEDLPFPDDEFDIIVAAFVVVHLKNPEIFFNEAYRVLKDGGKLIITNINQKEPPAVETEQGQIKIESYYHRPEEIIEALEKLAFGIEREELVKEKDVWINQIVVARK